MSKKSAGKAAAASTAASGGEFKDHGELPAWNRGDMPAPVPFGWKAVLASIGPGIVMLGGSIGTGEWLTGPAVTVKFQGAMLWIATLAIIGQSFLNCEVIRYALATGEPVFTGYMRTKPGPRFWAITYLICDFGMFLPAFAAALAQMLVAAYLGPDNPVTKEHNNMIMLVGISMCVMSFVLMLFGGKVYNTLVAGATIKVIWVLLFLLFIDLTLVTASQWTTIFHGFFFPFKNGKFIMPEGITWGDWATIAGFAAFAGGGGLSNATLSNYSREKGWGMGAHVGSIPSAVGGAHVELAPLGTVFKPTKEAMKRWNAWWKYVLFDQYGIWVAGCFAGIILPAAMSLRVIDPSKLDMKQMASIQAHGVSGAFPDHAQLFWVLTLITGFLIIWYTMIQALDHVTRRWTDIMWTSSVKAREAAGGVGVKKIYYSILLSYLCVNVGVLVFNLWIGATPFAILLITACTQGFATAVTAFHTWWVNRRFLPKELQASWWRNAGLLFCGVFYITMTCLAAYGKIRETADSNAKKAQTPVPYVARSAR